MARIVPLATETTSAQLALALFEELADDNRSITEAPSEIGFRRNRLFLDISELGLVASRALDAIHFLVSQDPEIHAAYDFDLSFFKWMMAYSSNNHKHLRKALREAQRATMEGEASTPDREKWGSKTLLTTVSINGGRLVCEVDPFIQKLIKDPERSYFFSLRIGNSFGSIYARRLYERLQDYLDRGTTGFHDVKTVREWLGCTSKFYADYSEFNRGAVKLAVSQINEHSDLTVEVKTMNIPGSKAVGKLKFDITQKQNWQPKRESLAWSQELYEVLQLEFGLRQEDFDTIRENRESWTDDRIQQAIEYTRYMATKSHISSIPGYFMNALKQQFLVPGLQKQVAQQRLLNEQALEAAKAKAKENLIRTSKANDDERVALGKRGLDLFAEMPSDEQVEALNTFFKSPMGVTAAKGAGLTETECGTADVLKNDAIAQLFGNYLFQKAKTAASPAKKLEARSRRASGDLLVESQ